jgi:hypothetical protein
MEHGTRIDQDIGARIRALRSGRGWTLDELATRSGVSRAMLVPDHAYTPDGRLAPTTFFYKRL